MLFSTQFRRSLWRKEKTEICTWLDTGIFHSMHWGINPPPPTSKTPPPLSCQAPLLNRQTVQADQLFLSLNISDFIFYVKIATPSPWKKSLPLYQQSPLKVKVLSSPPPFFSKFGWGLNPPPMQKEGVHTMYFDVWDMHLSKIILIFTSSGQGVVGWI